MIYFVINLLFDKHFILFSISSIFDSYEWDLIAISIAFLLAFGDLFMWPKITFFGLYGN